jgi:hypothetical protein
LRGTTDGQESQEESEEDVIRLRREAEQRPSSRIRAIERQATGAGHAGPFYLERAYRFSEGHADKNFEARDARSDHSAATIRTARLSYPHRYVTKLGYLNGGSS